MLFNKKTNLKLLGATLLVFFCFLLDLERGDWLCLFGRNDIYNKEVTFILYNILSYGLYHRLFMICIALPLGRRFAEEFQSHSFYFYVQRNGSTKYSLKYVLGAAGCGGVAAAGGLMLFVLLLRTKYPFFTQNNPIHSVLIRLHGYGSLLAEDKSGEYLLIFLLLYFCGGAMLTAIAVAVSVYFPNKHIVLATPYLAYCAYVEFAKATNIPNQMRLDRIFSGRTQPFEIAMSLAATGGVVLVALAVCIFLFKRGLQRRIEHER